MHQHFKLLELKKRLLNSSRFDTNYGSILGNFVRGITALQGYYLNFQSNLLSLLSLLGKLELKPNHKTEEHPRIKIKNEDEQNAAIGDRNLSLPSA